MKIAPTNKAIATYKGVKSVFMNEWNSKPKNAPGSVVTIRSVIPRNPLKDFFFSFCGKSNPQNLLK